MSVFQFLGKGRQELLEALEGTLYLNLPEWLEVPGIPFPKGKAFARYQKLLRVRLKQKLGEARITSYLETNPGWFSQMRVKLLQKQDNPGLLALWQREIRPHIQRGVWTVLGTVTSSTDYTSRLRKELNNLVGQEDASALIGNVSDPTELLPSLGIVAGLEQVASGKMSRQIYLEQFGHRGPHEFELSIPRPVEDPAWLNTQVERLRAAPVDIQGLIARQRASFEMAWERLNSQCPKKAKSIRRRLAESARRIRLRELARSEYVRDRWVIRLFALRAGELNGLGDDIFFLRLDEMLGLLAGEGSATLRIPNRKELFQRYRSLPRLPSIIRGHFDALQWANDPDRGTGIYAKYPSARVQCPPQTLKGSPGSAGRVEGVVRVIHNPEDGDQLKNGEILVATQTDIAWTLIFPRAAAVVTDVGAPLSHAAIVARELGIPAVVGCGDATTRLKTGDRVQVDGSAGSVTILL